MRDRRSGRRPLWGLLLGALLLVSCSDDGDDGLQEIVDAIRLEADDLGDGWREVGAESPGADDDTDLLSRCLPEDAGSWDAESDTTSFQRLGPAVPGQLRVWSVAGDDPDDLTDLHEQVRDLEFTNCFGPALVELLRSAADEVEVGEVLTEGQGDRTVVTAPLTVTAGGTTVDLAVRVTLVTRGRFGATLTESGPATDLDPGAHDGWADLLAERMPEPEDD